jgi:PPP family 3-phenylpropionic acid transporter
LLITTVRWLLIAFFPQHFVLLVLAQFMHAASFGSFHAIGVETVRRHFTRGSVGQGQAFYSAISFGAGGALGALMSGHLWAYGASLIFALAAGASFAGFLLMMKSVRF